MKENGIIALQPEPGVQFEIYEGTVLFAMRRTMLLSHFAVAYPLEPIQLL